MHYMFADDGHSVYSNVQIRERTANNLHRCNVIEQSVPAKIYTRLGMGTLLLNNKSFKDMFAKRTLLPKQKFNRIFPS